MSPADENSLTIRAAREADLAEASALCLRSKAHWGYDKAFMDACVEELTITPAILAESQVAIAEADSTMVGVAQVEIEGGEAELEKLFIDPPMIGHGVGRVLFNWALGAARDAGAGVMHVTADPQACGFYERMGFIRSGEEASGSIPGRMLPRLVLELA